MVMIQTDLTPKEDYKLTLYKVKKGLKSKEEALKHLIRSMEIKIKA